MKKGGVVRVPIDFEEKYRLGFSIPKEFAEHIKAMVGDSTISMNTPPEKAEVCPECGQEVS